MRLVSIILQVSVNAIVMDELRKIIEESEVRFNNTHTTLLTSLLPPFPLSIYQTFLVYIPSLSLRFFHTTLTLQIMQEDDKLWPVPDRIGRQVTNCSAS